MYLEWLVSSVGLETSACHCSKTARPTVSPLLFGKTSWPEHVQTRIHVTDCYLQFRYKRLPEVFLKQMMGKLPCSRTRSRHYPTRAQSVSLRPPPLAASRSTSFCKSFCDWVVALVTVVEPGSELSFGVFDVMVGTLIWASPEA